MRVTGKTIDNKPCSQWEEVFTECRKYERFVVEVTDYSDMEISERQNGWLHCKNGPIRLLMKRNKMTFIEAKIYLKTEFGWSWFVKGVGSDDYLKATGVLYWYCEVAACETKAFHLLEAESECGIRQCPGCGSSLIRLIAIQSINKKSVSTIKMWFDEIIKHFAKDLLPPNPDFNKTLT